MRSAGAVPAASGALEADAQRHLAVSRFQLPAPARWHYLLTVSTRGTIGRGEAELQWRHDGSLYEAQLETNVPGQRQRFQHSAGLVTAQGLAPLRFSDKGRGEQAAHFDRASGRISFSNNSPEAALDAGAQDRLSVVLQLSAMLAADAARFPPGTRITLQTATTHEAQPWQFAVEGVDELQLAAGTVAAVKLSHEPLGPYDARLELWLAPGADYAPARLRLTQPNGDWVDQQWSSTDRSE